METSDLYFSPSLQETFRFFYLSTDEMREYREKSSALNHIVEKLFREPQPHDGLLAEFDAALALRRAFMAALAKDHGFSEEAIITITERKCFLRADTSTEKGKPGL